MKTSTPKKSTKSTDKEKSEAKGMPVTRTSPPNVGPKALGGRKDTTAVQQQDKKGEQMQPQIDKKKQKDKDA